jgi:hypothetical protein
VDKVKIWKITNMPIDAGSEFVRKSDYDSAVKEMQEELKTKEFIQNTFSKSAVAFSIDNSDLEQQLKMARASNQNNFNMVCELTEKLADYENALSLSKLEIYKECAHPQSVWYECHVTGPQRSVLEKWKEKV